MLYLIIPSLSINALSKNLSSKLNYLTKYHSCKKKNLSLSKFSTQKMHSIKNTHNHKKNLVKFCKKKFQKKIFKKMPKKFPQKKFQKKIEERLPRFSRSQIGGGGRGLYKCVMVITLLYTCTGM